MRKKKRVFKEFEIKVGLSEGLGYHFQVMKIDYLGNLVGRRCQKLPLNFQLGLFSRENEVCLSCRPVPHDNALRRVFEILLCIERSLFDD